MATKPNAGGRPGLVKGEQSTPMNVRLSARQFDRTYKKAHRDRMSMPDVVRRALAQWLDDDDEKA